MFVERAAARGSPIKLSDDDAAVVGNICRNLDGLALAIELAAGRVTAHGVQGTAALLDDRFKLEWQGRRTALPRHQTLTCMFDWSYSLLSGTERLVLRRLSIFVGAFGLDAAAKVVLEPGADTVQFEHILAGLVEKSLVSPLSGDADVRYRLLETTRAYAFGKLSEADEADMVAERHARYYTDLLQSTAFAETTVRKGDNLFSISAHLGNIRTALNWCFSDRGKASLGIALAAGVAAYFMKRPCLTNASGGACGRYRCCPKLIEGVLSNSSFRMRWRDRQCSPRTVAPPGYAQHSSEVWRWLRHMVTMRAACSCSPVSMPFSSEWENLKQL